jgi:hypothetical protein
MFVSACQVGFCKQQIVGSSFFTVCQPVFFDGRGIHWHSMLILRGMWCFLPFSCFCCVRVYVCETISMLLLDYLSALLLKFNNSYPFIAILFSSFVCRIPFRIYSGCLMVMNCFSFCLSLEIVIAPSVLLARVS